MEMTEQQATEFAAEIKANKRAIVVCRLRRLAFSFLDRLFDAALIAFFLVVFYLVSVS